MNVRTEFRQSVLSNEAVLITSGSRGWADHYSDSGALFLRMTNLPREGIRLSLDDVKYVSLPTNSSEGQRTLIEKGDILISITAELGKIAYVADSIGEAYVNQHVALVRIASIGADSKFIAHYLSSRKQRNLWNVIGDAGAKAGLNLKAIGEFPIQLPPIPEQEAIAETLSTWDAAIEKTEHLIAAKEKSLAGRYQRDFSEEGIRSNGWNRVPLCELFTEVTRSVEGKSLKPYSISAGKGFVSQEEKFGRDISGAQYQNYIHLKPGEFAYNKGNSKRFQQGCIYLLTDEEIAVPNAFISFAPKSDKLVIEFYKHYFLGNRHARELRKCISSGARGDGLLNVNTEDFFQIKVPNPPVKEQKALAEALDLLVTEIELMRQKLELLKLQKRGLMQKLLTGTWHVKVA